MNSKSHKGHCIKSVFSPEIIANDSMRTAEFTELENSHSRFLNRESRTKVNLIFFRNHSKHYYDVHPSSKHSNNPAPSKDCTHWCGYIPILWYPIWIQLQKLIIG